MTFTPPSSSSSSTSIRVVFSLFHLHIYSVGHFSIKNMSKYSKDKIWRSILHSAAAATGESAQCTGVYVRDPQWFSLSQTQHCHSEEVTVVTKSGRVRKGGDLFGGISFTTCSCSAEKNRCILKNVFLKNIKFS